MIVSDRNNKSIYVVSVASAIELVEFFLANGGDAFWLDSRTIGYVVVDDEETKTVALYSLSVHFTNETPETTSGPPALLGKFPTASPSSFRYAAELGVLVFLDNVYEDGDLIKVPGNDERWQDRGDTALVYDDACERHWTLGHVDGAEAALAFHHAALQASGLRTPRSVDSLGTGSTMC